MGGPRYGKAFGCIDRSVFGLTVGGLVFAYGVARILRAALVKEVYGTELSVQYTCHGKECYEVFTCRGLISATAHFREPLDTLASVVCGAAGVIGAMQHRRGMLELLKYYLLVSAVAQAVIMLADAAAFESCGEFPTNMVQQGLLWMLPTFPIMDSVKEKIRMMPSFPTEETHRIAGVSIWGWYLVSASARLVFLATAAYEVDFFSRVMDRGLLGLGVNYGIDNWPEMEKALFAKRAKAKHYADFGIILKGEEGYEEDEEPLLEESGFQARDAQGAGGFYIDVNVEREGASDPEGGEWHDTGAAEDESPIKYGTM